MFNYLYKLAGKVPVRCESVGEWATWLHDNSAPIKYFYDLKDGEVVEVCTFFSGIDLAEYFAGANRGPQLFETRIICGSYINAVRCATFEEAELQHDTILNLMATNFFRSQVIEVPLSMP